MDCRQSRAKGVPFKPWAGVATAFLVLLRITDKLLAYQPKKRIFAWRKPIF